MRRLLSLFDYSGTWSAPFVEAGWDVIQMDLKHGNDVSDFSCEHLTEHVLEDGNVDGILMAPPCTTFTKSGARWWDTMDKQGRTAASVELVRQGLRTVEFIRPDFWALENPPGRLPKLVPDLTRCKRFDFDPCDFAGYLGGNESIDYVLAQIADKAARQDWAAICTLEAELTKSWNRYTKRTAIWGHFPDLVTDRREPIRVCAAGSWLMRLGGSSEETKASRSDTPEGFARAFFEAVKDYRLDWDAIMDGEAFYPIFDDE